MKITKARLKEIIQEELQSEDKVQAEGVLSAFLAKRKDAKKKPKEPRRGFQVELKPEEKERVDILTSNNELVKRAIKRVSDHHSIIVSAEADPNEKSKALQDMLRAIQSLSVAINAPRDSVKGNLERVREGEKKTRHPGEAPPETLDDLIQRAVAGGIDPYGGGAERFKKDIIRAVKKELGLKEGGHKGEGSMADSQLNRIADLAVMVDDLVSDETNLPEWVESKITKAQDYMSAVLNYMKGEIADAQEEMMEEIEDLL